MMIINHTGDPVCLCMYACLPLYVRLSASVCTPVCSVCMTRIWLYIRMYVTIIIKLTIFKVFVNLEDFNMISNVFGKYNFLTLQPANARKLALRFVKCI